ncbi:HNH homing endonuclease [Enterococcus phage vB_OCPT_SDS2]|nr:HNH homing endonuclease [Enterococcus phage vB_OCPT_SDS2]
MELWKPVVGYERFYEVSNLGNVRSVTRKVKNVNGTRTINGRVLKKLDRKGYIAYDLSMFGKTSRKAAHRLVAKAFIENPKNLPVVNHIDEDTTNNAVDNLEWVDFKSNCNHGTRNKRIAESNGHNIKVTRKSTGEVNYYNGMTEASLAEGQSSNYFRNVFKYKGIKENHKYKVEISM